ncbi:hypothetical protein EVJ50_04115 [Synechococcus sp. RSCCF101]|uniref:hypothetical protein n=1 Tax=Synechococcus sp. RSCCF101 TaxID=2511069 RepID=UPI00124533C1|nr:hypothetical protein [Synechococcus sp. RSCCF101]QEY31559.1 hypothetical protein EVJ50_04115 [Synechococcus sp. RSCCF101]
MTDRPYLVALALVGQGERRAMPLAGQSQAPLSEEAKATSESTMAEPPEAARTLALELLLRIWQRSDDGPLQRTSGNDSLLILEVPMERLPEDLPALKAKWIRSGETAALLEGLRRICPRGWTLTIAKREPMRWQAW